MFGFSWSEILIIGVVALVLIGPNDLPRAMKTAARWMSAGRKLAREFQGHVDELVREAELEDLREQARKIAMRPVSSHIESIIDPHRELADALSSQSAPRHPFPAVPSIAPQDEPPAAPGEPAPPKPPEP
jgi:sec-independent protein translocase protein TatB